MLLLVAVLGAVVSLWHVAPASAALGQAYGPLSSDADSVAVGDLNGDGRPDLVIGRGNGTVDVLLQGAGNTFTEAPGSPITFGSNHLPEYVALADFNGDGKLDIVGQSANGMEIADGTGGGAFAAPAQIDTNVTDEPVKTADLNGDGHQDLVFLDDDGAVHVLLGDGDGAFSNAPGTPLYTPGQALSVAVGDVDGGNPDIVVPQNQNTQGGGFVVFHNNLPTGFVAHPVGDTYETDATLADVDGDGHADVILARNVDGANIGVWHGDGSGGFTQIPGSPFSNGGGAGVGSLFVAAGDLLGSDGHPDIAVIDTNLAIQILQGDGQNDFTHVQTLNGLSNPISMTVADVNGDGKPDLLVADQTHGVEVYLEGTATASFTASKFNPESGEQITLDASGSTGTGTLHYAWDLNGDGTYETDGGTNPQLQTSLTGSGTITVGLKVTDDTGVADTTTRTFEIGEPVAVAPSWVPTNPASGQTVSAPGQAVTISAGGSGGSGTVTYTYHFDDGSADVVGTADSVQHTFTAAGTHSVTVSATDGHTSASQSLSIPVEPLPSAAVSVSPAIVAPNATVTVSAAASTGGAGQLHYAYDLNGDGLYETDGGTTDTHTTSFPSIGPDTVGVRVTDSAASLGASADQKSTATAYVDVANQLKAALSYTPTVPRPNQSFTLDASGTTGGVTWDHSDNPVALKYAWDLDGNGTYETDGGTTPTKAVSLTAGHHTLGVQVTDARGQTDTATVAVDVAAAPSVGESANPSAPFNTDTVTLTATPTAGVAPYTYAWDLDGNDSYETAGGSSATLQHRFNVGTYQVGVQLTDAKGETATTSLKLVVTNPLSVGLAAGSANPQAGDQVVFSATSPSGGTPPYTYAWDFDGDGSYETSTGTTGSAGHAFTAGSHKVGLQITDSRGHTATATTTISVDPKLAASFTYSPAAPTDHQTITLNASGTAGGRAPLKYAWDLNGDGTYETAGGVTQTVSFNSPGSETVGLRVTDAVGRVQTYQKTITVIRSCLKTVSFQLTTATTTGCIEQMGTGDSLYYTSTDPIKVNGIPLAAPNGVAITLTPPHGGSGGGSIGISTATVALDGVTLFDGALNWQLPAGGNGDEADVVTFDATSAAKLAGLDISGSVTIRFGRTQSGSAYSVFELNVDLPSIIKSGPSGNSGGVTGSVAVKVDDSGVHLDGVMVQASNVYIGSLEIQSVCFSYLSQGSTAVSACPIPSGGDSDAKPYIQCQQSDANSAEWDGNATIVLPTESKTTITAFGGLEGNQLSYLGGTVTNLGHSVELDPGVFLNNIGAALCVGPPLQVKGTVGISALPGKNGDQLLLNGSFLYTDAYQGKPWSIVLDGQLNLFGQDAANGHLEVDGTGAFNFNFNANWNFPTSGTALASINGGVSGWFDPNPDSFDVQGNVKLCIFGTACTGGSAVVSSDGVAACLTFISLTTWSLEHDAAHVSGLNILGYYWQEHDTVLQAGFGYRYATKEFDLLGNSCDISPWEATQPASDVAAAASASRSFTVPSGATVYGVRLDGAGAAPAVTLVGPGGQRITSPKKGGAVKKGSYIIGLDPNKHQTDILLAHPAAGRWTIRTQPGSAPITTLSTSHAINPATVQASVRRHAGARELDYAVAAAPGDSVTFEETGDSIDHRLTGGHAVPCPAALQSNPAGSYTPICGQVRFRPAFGPGGKRSINAVVTRDGTVVSGRTVVTYIAPAPALPKAAVGGVTRTKHGLLVSWRRVSAASRYDVLFDAADGRKLVYTTGSTARCVRLAIPKVGRREAVSVGIRGMRQDDAAGAVAELRLRSKQKHSGTPCAGVAHHKKPHHKKKKEKKTKKTTK
jgi:hypothetical protein